MKRRSFGATVGSAAVTGVLVLWLLVLIGRDGAPGEPVAEPSLMGQVVGLAFFGFATGCAAGVVQFCVGWLFRLRFRRREKRPVITPATVDPWAETVDRCKQSAKAVTRLIESLPATAAGEWLGRIAETMSANLADIEALAEAGRAALPATDPLAVAEVRQHPLYGLLQKSAGEFTDVVGQINQMLVELHTPAGLEEVRTQLQVLAEQLPLLRRSP
ncbi:hypothetical protein JOF56_006679 [Kibdelosporangium banguiense]|uniref:DUF4239 domain-containing protein n=1 Tax=Kibdelosporangium banguiense TaxID=1365924 RepID=A0ABS4TPH4_9PSEU|nr:hypothetical protein [Kibdelosporangium banguiense]MBP2326294.1 hypothetical protein [Kibdelosporangium banguiense]